MKLAAPCERSANAIVLTIALDRADGIERVAFRCRIAATLATDASDEALAEYLAYTQIMIGMLNRLDLYKDYRAH